MPKKQLQRIVITTTTQKKLLLLLAIFLVLEMASTSSFVGINRVEPYFGFLLGIVCSFLFGRKAFFPIALVSLAIAVFCALAGLPKIAEEAGNAVYVFLVIGTFSAMYDYLRSLRKDQKML